MGSPRKRVTPLRVSLGSNPSLSANPLPPFFNMAKKILIGALAGGFVLFVWSSIWWAMSGIPVAAIKTFKDEAAVEKALRDNAPEPGYYVLPTPNVPGDQAEKRMEKVTKGPFVAATVNVNGLGPIGPQLGMSFTGNAVCAALVTWMLLMTSLSFGGRVLFCIVAGLFAGMCCLWPQIVWWGYPGRYIALAILDQVIAWTLAGFVLALITRD
jgi:hypothetical protein